MSHFQSSLNLPFTTFYFYENYVVSEPHEGIVIGDSEIDQIREICATHYSIKKFVYISHRINNFSVNPMVYKKLGEMKNMVGFGVVSQKVSSLNMAAFEKNFSKAPFEMFLDLEKAKGWIQKILTS
ncbi:MAG: hypothetical protein R3259_01555 [Salinimicrobium sediminis]|nr:hypothetical protein [Salinimicrobium sediminis]